MPEIAALEARLTTSPDDFQLRRQLDALYLRSGQLDPIVKMWTAFLETHQDHAEAIFERSGTYYHLRDMERAKADARRACELRLAAACQVVARFDGTR